MPNTLTSLTTALFLFLLPTTSLWGQTLNPQFFIDTAGIYTPSTVLTAPEVAWQTLQESDHFSTFYDNYVTFSVEEAPAEAERFLTFQHFFDTIQLFSASGQLIAQTGSFWARDLSVPYDQRALPLPNAGGQYLLRVNNEFRNFRTSKAKVAIPILQINREAYLRFRQDAYQKSLTYNIQQGYFLSLLSLIFGLILLTFLVTRERLYGAYLAYILSVFLYYLIRRWQVVDAYGLGLPQYYKFAFESFWTFVIVLTYVHFVVHFLGKELLQKIHRLEQVLRWTQRAALFFTAACMLLLALPEGIWWSNTVANVGRVVVVLLGLATVFLMLKSRHPFARLLAGGIGFLILGLGLLLLNDFLKAKYAINLEPFGISYLQWGVLGELLFYLLALLWRHQQLRAELVASVAALVALTEQNAALQATLQDQAAAFLSINAPGKRLRRWARTQVQCFVAEGETSRCFLDGDRTEPIRLRLAEVQTQLPPNFLRVHRSYIANMDKAERFVPGRPNLLYLTGKKEPIPVGGGNYVEKVRECLSQSLHRASEL